MDYRVIIKRKIGTSKIHKPVLVHITGKVNMWDAYKFSVAFLVTV